MKEEQLHFQLRRFFSPTQCFQSLLFCCRSNTYPKSLRAPILCFEAWRSSEPVSLSCQVSDLFLPIKIRILNFANIEYSGVRSVAATRQTGPCGTFLVPQECERVHQRSSISTGLEGRNVPGTLHPWSPLPSITPQLNGPGTV